MRNAFAFAQGVIPTPLSVIGFAAINLGDLWSDTSGATPILKVCTSLNPIAFTAAGSGVTLETNGSLNSSQTIFNLVAGSNVTLTDTGGGAIQVTAAGAGAVNFADAETPSGTINGVNTTFTLAAAPSPAGSLELFLNGVLQKAGGADYTLSSATITTTVAPQTGDVLLAWYRH